MSIKIIVYCGTRVYGEGLSCLLQGFDNLQLIGFTSDEKQIEELMQYEPDVIISDLTCSQTVLNLLHDKQNKKVLLVSDSVEIGNDHLLDLIDKGVGGVLPKNADSHQIQMAIQKLHDGELWIDRHTISEVLSHRKQRKSPINLTNKETEVLKHICAGMTNKEIAQKLNISEQTVKSHCNHLYKKFRVKNRLKLAMKAPECSPEHGYRDRLH